MAATYITDAAGNTKRYELEPEDVLLLGSDGECDICIADTDGVAAQHCEVLWDDGYYILNTCTDELKVQVGDDSLDCVALVPGVEYRIGGALLLFMASEEDEQEYLEEGDEDDEEAEEDDFSEEMPADDMPPEESEASSAPKLSRRSASPAKLRKKAVPGAPRRRKKKVRPRTVVRSTRRRDSVGRSVSLRARRTVVRPTAVPRRAPRLKSAAKVVRDELAEELHTLEGEESAGADFLMSIIKPLYVIAVLVMAFLAGLTVHHLIVTGQFYPTSRIRSADSP